MKERIAIVDGIRTPLCKAGGVFKDMQAEDLGAVAVSELLARSELPAEMVDELIFGNVAQPAGATNVARVLALKAGLPESTPAYTVQRNCGSGAEALTTAAAKMLAGEISVAVVGGTESMSNIPFLYQPRAKQWFEAFSRARTLAERLKVLLALRLKHFQPIVGLVSGLTDPISGLIMGKTAEVLACDFHITREEQDAYALLSHERAMAAQAEGRLAAEIVPVPVPPVYTGAQQLDDGPRADQSLAKLQKLRPYFDRHNGTVTVGNTCPITDAAAALLVMTESRARDLGLKPLGYLVDYAYAGLDPSRMGLGPAFATAKLMRRKSFSMQDLDLIELNEAFAAQVIANERAFASAAYAQAHFDRYTALGELDRGIMNVNGGAIALGHPVGMTGARLVLTALHELRRRDGNLALATMCIGGGQGGALLLEAA